MVLGILGIEPLREGYSVRRLMNEIVRDVHHNKRANCNLKTQDI
jgi:hypothetical protein